MGCLFVVFGSFFPRIATLLIWLARPVIFSTTFGGSWLIPTLGIIFLPFTTLMWVLLWTATPVGVNGWDWLWLGLAALCDVSTWAASAYTNREKAPWYETGVP